MSCGVDDCQVGEVGVEVVVERSDLFGPTRAVLRVGRQHHVADRDVLDRLGTAVSHEYRSIGGEAVEVRNSFTSFRTLGDEFTNFAQFAELSENSEGLSRERDKADGGPDTTAYAAVKATFGI